MRKGEFCPVNEVDKIGQKWEGWGANAIMWGWEGDEEEFNDATWSGANFSEEPDVWGENLHREWTVFVSVKCELIEEEQAWKKEGCNDGEKRKN